ncbi:polysaccharide pyruvyl transferase family protein [Cobetia sp. 14N.309.X.WAT.E.A4]|uniref:polysaccharide pyruvyl transferase family protein n=1 Tax=Cobetia sp. 14N.309.X.WAT.E.A4 TaxID=2998323 RepID=UPI0025AFB116|nr:polysaccharide pyruvyl transferase family protein [Cobetia sp. 14N.309.X.WAT.E.A4]MDN2656483.1 polysaccharide pyruvyl transferase family protein [Cobetia sp. 14N.309.X.WAT.E.A4]
MIYLIGGSGGPNYGDELIISLWIKFYREKGYNGPIVVDCLSKKNSERMHSKYSNVYFTTFIKKLAKGRDGSTSFYIDRGANFIIENKQAFIKNIEECFDDNYSFDLDKDSWHIHLYGGGYINGVWKNSFSLLGAASQLKKMFGTKIFATGLGLAPINIEGGSDANHLKNVISTFDLFEVRDLDSYNQIVDICGFNKNIISGLDDSFLYSYDELCTASKHKSIHISGFSKSFEKMDDATLINYFSDANGKYDNIYFWVCNKSDIAAGDRISNLVGGVTKLTCYNLVNFGPPLNPSDIMITARFHPHFIAARAGLHGKYISNSEFYVSKHSSIVDLGSTFTKLKNVEPVIKMENSSTNNLCRRDVDLVHRKNHLAQFIVKDVI